MMWPADAPAKPDRRAKTVSRPHCKNLGPASDTISMVFRHVICVAETAAMVSRRTGITDTYTLGTMIYKYVRDPRVNSAVTQAAIKTGVAAMKGAGPDAKPEFKVPAIKLNNQRWRLNPVAGGYVITCNVGSGKCPIYVAIGVPKNIGDRILEHRPGELTITPEKYVISYTKDVPPMEPRDPSLGSKYDIVELISGVDRVAGPPKNVVGADINTANVTIYDSHAAIQIDMSKELDAVLEAKRRQMSAARQDHTNWEEKRGRPISRKREDTEERDKVLHGGAKKYNKLKRDSKAARRHRDTEKEQIMKREREYLAAPRKKWRDRIRELKGNPEQQDVIKAERDRFTKAAKAETRRLKREADERFRQKQGRLKGEMKGCVVSQNVKEGASSLQKISANNSKMRAVAKATRNLEYKMHVVSCFVVCYAQATDALISLEDLRNMSAGWMRSNKRFGKGMRRRLYSAAMLKMSDMIWYKARWSGIVCVRMNPYHTSKLCAMCRYVLEGDYHFRYCSRCDVRVDRDVNAADNVRRTTAAARYGQQVLAYPDEARRTADLIICPADLTTGGVAILVDGEVAWGRR